MQKFHVRANPATEDLVLDAPLPEGTDPALMASLQDGVERAVSPVLASGWNKIFEDADRLAEILI